MSTEKEITNENTSELELGNNKLQAFVYFVFGALIAIALLSFDPGDPTFNRASGNAVANMLGSFGSYLADLLLQFFGLSSILFVFVLMTLSLRNLYKPYKPKKILGTIYTIIATIALGTLIAVIPTYEKWPYYVGLGGLSGDLVWRLVGFSQLKYTNYITISAALVIFLSCSLLAIKANIIELKQVFFALSKVVYRAILVLIRINLFIINGLRKLMRKKPIVVPDYNIELLSQEKVREKQKNEPVEALVEMKKPKVKVPKLQQASFDLKDIYQLPSLVLLQDYSNKQKTSISQSSLSQNAKLLESVLKDFGVQGEIIKVRPGPVVTLYELEPAPGTKSSRIIGLADDIARSMSAISARIAVVPGRNAIGIELPNAKRETVFLREMLEFEGFQDKRFSLPIALGKDIGGEPVVVDLTRMPHLLVAGTTGSGKSVAINTMILSFLYRMPPEQCKFIMIDPKMLELSVYEGIPHLLAPVVTEPSKAVVALKWAVREMENRYRLMSNVSVRNITGYNKKVEDAIKGGEKLEKIVQTGFDPETGKPIMEKMEIKLEKLPFIVIIVDEMADLMLTAGKDIEGLIQRLAQMARAAGIHLIMATQRPSVDVITGVIKANFPTRISFQVTSRIDSRTILGEQGAEQLLGMGDMLYMGSGTRTVRVHGPFVDDKEVNDVVQYLKTQGEPNYVEEVTRDDEEASFNPEDSGSGDDLYDQAVAIVLRDRRASTSHVQRHLKIGYNRAANIMDKMEQEGVVSAANHTGRREVLVQ